jgi:hypothetical protein
MPAIGDYRSLSSLICLLHERLTKDLIYSRPAPDLRRSLRIRWRGVDLPFRSFFDKLQTVEPGAIVDNKRLGSVLEWIKDRQTAYGPAWNSSHPKRRRPANNLRPEP